MPLWFREFGSVVGPHTEGQISSGITEIFKRNWLIRFLNLICEVKLSRLFELASVRYECRKCTTFIISSNETRSRPETWDEINA